MSRPVVIVVMALAVGIAASAPARADVIEQVVATVNDEAIFLSDLRRRAAPFLPQVFAAPTEAERLAGLHQLYQELLEHMIDEELFRQAARRMQVRVTNEDVERALRNVRRQNNLTEEQFWDAVRAQGYTESQYRTDLRRQLLRLKVLNQRVRGRVNITEEEVRRAYDQRVRRANREARFRASHVFFEIPEGAGATEVAAVMHTAQEVHDRMEAGELTLAQAIEENAGGELGWLSQGDLPPELEQSLMSLRDGGLGEPVRGPNGIHIFVLHERQQGAAGIPPYEEVKEQIFREMLDRAMAHQEEVFLSELQRDAIIVRRLGASRQ